MTDTEAMTLIHRALDGVEWSADTLNEIARIVENTGRVIRNSDQLVDVPEYIWPDPDNAEGWVDAWNGAYETLEEALRDAAAGVGRPWVLRYGEGLVTEAEMKRRLGGAND